MSMADPNFSNQDISQSVGESDIDDNGIGTAGHQRKFVHRFMILTKKRFEGCPIGSPPFPVKGGAHRHNDVVTCGRARILPQAPRQLTSIADTLSAQTADLNCRRGESEVG
jgi:hypothetical protein